MALSILVEDCALEKVVIVGGGVAGLSCLNALLDYQVTPLLIEGGSIGSPKMCGEFLAPPALSILQKWEIGPIEPIQQVRFNSTCSQFNFTFKQHAGAMMRSEAERQLSMRATKLGGRIRENTRLTKVIPATSTSPYILHLESGEIIEAEVAIFATGRLGQTAKDLKPLPYFGIKFHIEEVLEPNALQMYSAKGFYFGLVPISSTSSNVTCLLKQSVIKDGDSKKIMLQIIKKFPALADVFNRKNLKPFEWLTTPSPDFILKKLPDWTNAYWIGDASVSLPPATGLGFAHSIKSGLAAADFYLQKNPTKFVEQTKAEINKKLMLGKLFHHIMLNPLLTYMTYPLLQTSPWFLNKCLKRLGYT